MQCQTRRGQRGKFAAKATRNHSGLGEWRTEEGVVFGDYFGSWTFDGERCFSESGPGLATCANLRLLTAYIARDALACVDVEQMNCIREMVVFFDGQKGDIYVAVPKWQRHFEPLTTI